MMEQLKHELLLLHIKGKPVCHILGAKYHFLGVDSPIIIFLWSMCTLCTTMMVYYFMLSLVQVQSQEEVISELTRQLREVRQENASLQASTESTDRYGLHVNNIIM